MLNALSIVHSTVTKHVSMNIPSGAKKTSQTLACVIQPSGQSESAQKHNICDDQTSSNM